MSAGLEPAALFPPAPELPVRGRLLSTSAPNPAVASNAAHRLNTVLGWLLIAVLALAPIPLGSNRPAFWTIWATVIGLLAVGYGAALLMLRAPARVPVLRLWPEFTGFCLLAAWLVVQMLPIGRWLPDALTLAPGLGTNARSISLDPGSTLMTLLNFATYGLLFFLVLQAGANRRRARSMLYALFLVVALIALYGLVSLVQLGDTLLGFEKLSYKGVATGTFVNRNSFATFLAAGLAMGVPLLLDSPDKRRSIGQVRTWIQPVLVLLGMLFIAAALLATGSRMGATAGLFGVIVALTLSLLKGEKTRVRWWLFAILIVAAAVVAVLYGAGTLERSLFVEDPGREELYRQVWPAILDRPITGYGGGSFATVFPALQHAPLGANDTVWDKAHSTYLSLWFELGVIAGSIPLLIIAALLFRAGRGLGDPSSRGISIAAIAVAVVFAVHSLADFSAEIMANAFLLTAVLALGAAGTGTTRAGER